MDKDTRNAIERATQRIRKLLEDDFASQLEGTFDVLRAGSVAAKAGPHLTPRQVFQRDKIVAAVEHKQAAGMSAAEAVADYLRDAAFTTLNRFIALKMLEARELAQECITKGEQSSGYREFCGMAPGVALLPESAGYRIYVESLFDELATEVKVLFDRRDPASVLWPRRKTFEALLDVLNGTDLASVWGEDETIGWVYQYFNGSDERRAMREASQAPRNSRELAVRNQFFTPRYVVEFLVDNTLGRIWLEMYGCGSALAEGCRYLVPSESGQTRTRPMKDPRDIRILDPACGSGHFLLYCFELLLTIYDEAWTASTLCLPRMETNHTLRDDYGDLTSLRRAAPALILQHNVHGVDIDPRAAQIAAFALWLRAQRGWRERGFSAADRYPVRRTHIVIAEPIPGEPALVDQFAAQLTPPLFRDLFVKMVDEMRLAGELGSLVPVEEGIAVELDRARKQFDEQREITGYLPGIAPARRQGELDLSGIDNNEFFHEAEGRIVEALRHFTEGTVGADSMRRRLFTDDAAQGIALIDLLRKRFDVVLMNPPFGEFLPVLFSKLAELYPDSKRDLGVAFIERGIALLSDAGLVGALVSRKPFFVDTQGEWRARFPGRRHFVAFADLGHRVLDNALVEVAAVAIRASDGSSRFVDCLAASDKQTALLEAVQGKSNASVVTRELTEFSVLPSTQFAYKVDTRLLNVFRTLPAYEPLSGNVRMGLTTSDNVRFVRLWWELEATADGRRWIPIAKGGEYAPYFSGFELMVKWEDGHGEMAAYNLSVGNEAQSRRGSAGYFKPAITYTERTASRFSARILPAGTIFTGAGPGILPNDEKALLSHLAVFTSWCFGALYEVCLGGGDAVHSGAAARHYTSGLLGKMPFPRDLARLATVQDDIEEIVELSVALSAAEGTSPYSRSMSFASSTNVTDMGRVLTRERASTAATIVECSGRIEKAVTEAYGLDLAQVRPAIMDLVGPHPDWLPRREPAAIGVETRQLVRELFAMSMDALVDRVSELLGNARYLTLKSYCGDRRLELVAHAACLHPRSVAELVGIEGITAAGAVDEVAAKVVEQTFERLWLEQKLESNDISLAVRSIAFDDQHIVSLTQWSVPRASYLYADDPGHAHDLVSTFLGALVQASSATFEMAMAELLPGGADGWRHYFANKFFAEHIKRRSMHRRSAPIYWQLSTFSASYSVWMHLHSLTKDTFYKVQNDCIAPKLAHEERRLDSLRREVGENPNAADRKLLAGHETFVDELRAFLEEVQRVAPLWNPNLDDGVIINFSPLWRLVPHHRAWQKELKTTWKALCSGDCDWAHLAMHLWPERVVPKCAADRSLAIAHGLEDVFWVEGSDGKWTARAASTKPLDELVRERGSAAVKAALATLLDAPAASATGRTGGRPRGSSAATNVGSR